MFGQHRTPLRFKDLITGRKILLLNLQRADPLSVGHGVTIAGLVIHDLIRAAENIGEYTPEAERVPHMLMVDEAERYLGDDLRMGFAELRKFRMPVCLGFQDTSAVRTEKLDLMPRILSQGGLQFSFQQKNPDDIDLLSRFYGLANLDFTEIMDVRDRPAGHRKVIVRSVSVGATTGSTRTEGESLTLANGVSAQDSTAHNTQRQQTTAKSHTDSRGSSASIAMGTSEQEGWSEQDGGSLSKTRQQSTTKGSSAGETRTETNTDGEARTLNADMQKQSVNLSDGQTKAHGTSLVETKQQGETNGFSNSESWAIGKTGGTGKSRTDTQGRTRGVSDGTTITHGSSVGDSTGHTDGVSRTLSAGLTTGVGTSEGQSVTFGFSESFVPETYEEERPTGKLRRSVPDQLAFFAKLLRTMPHQHALVGTNDAPSRVVKILDTPDAFEAQGKNRSAAFRRAIVESLKRKLMAAHPFYFSPEEVFAAAPLVPEPTADATDDDNPIA
jgi:hypothetical protein